MMKWVGRILYVLALGVVTFIVILMSNVSKIDKFKEDSLQGLHNDSTVTQDEINSFIISYTAYEKTDFSYHKITPVYSFSGKATDDKVEGDDKTSFNISLSIYLVNLFNESGSLDVDAYFFLIDSDFLVNLGTDEEPNIGITSPILTIEFNEPLRTLDSDGNVQITKDDNDNEVKSTSFTFSVLYRGEDVEAFYGWAFPAGLRKYDNKEDLKLDSFVEITRFEIKYINYDSKTKTALSMVNSATSSETPTPNPDPITTITNGTREFSLDKDNSFLSWSVPRDEAATTDGIYYVRFDLSGYNYILIRNISIFVVIALILTYLLFFNKHVVAHIREKKIQKKYEAAKEQDGEGKEKSIDTSPIFTDNNDTQQNGVKKKRK